MSGCKEKREEEDGDAVDRGTAVEKDGKSEREKMEGADGTKKR